MEEDTHFDRIGTFNTTKVILAIIILLVMFFILLSSIRPLYNFAQGRNTRRSIDLNYLADAYIQYSTDHVKSPLNVISCPNRVEIGTAQENLNLARVLVDDYIVSVPHDPQKGSPEYSGYTICLANNGRITISAKYAENGEHLEVRK